MCKNRHYLHSIEPFVRIPSLLMKLGLSSLALAVFMALAQHAEYYHPSLRQIARDAGISENTVRKGLRELVNKRVITTTSRTGQTLIISFNRIEQWDLPQDLKRSASQVESQPQQELRPYNNKQEKENNTSSYVESIPMAEPHPEILANQKHLQTGDDHV